MKAGQMHPRFQEVIAGVQRLTIKVGSSLVIDRESGAPNTLWMRGLAEDIASLGRQGKSVLLVSSGAVALGRTYLGLAGKRVKIEDKQAAAAAGQPRLMSAWEESFASVGLKTGQILLTREDTEIHNRWVNACRTVESLFRLGCLPIVNENDTLATEEIRFGDNDRLAARAALLMKSEALILLSDIDGLYSADPRQDPQARHIDVVETLDASIEEMAGGANRQAGVGTGGMTTKLAAAKIAGAGGCATVIASGQPLQPLSHVVKFTLMRPQVPKPKSYKAWIAGTVKPKGDLVLDSGAHQALLKGKSLLPVGIIDVVGSFEAGASVSLMSIGGAEIGRGIVSYGSDAIRLIRSQSSRNVEAILGYRHGDEVVHRDRLALI